MAARHIGLGPGLINEDEAARIKLALIPLPLRSPLGDVGTILLAGVQAFFEADALVLEEVPDRIVADLDSALRQLGKQRPQRHIRLLSKTSQQPGAFSGKCIAPRPTHPSCRRATGRPEPLRPLHHAGDADSKGCRNRPAALASRNRRNHAFAKIKGIGSRH